MCVWILFFRDGFFFPERGPTCLSVPGEIPRLPNGNLHLKCIFYWRYTQFSLDHIILKKTTPRKINIEPENDGLEDDFPFPGVYSQVPC